MRALVLALALLVLCVAPAGAETWHGSDPTSDVTLFTHRPDPAPCGTSTYDAVPADALRDVTRLAVDHRADTIELRLGMSRVSTRDTDTIYGFQVTTPGRIYILSVARAHPRRPLTPSLVQRPRRLHPDECGNASFAAAGLACPGLQARADRRRDRIEVSLPRSCVGDPRWVEVTAQAYDYSVSPDDGESSLEDIWGLTGAAQVPSPSSPRVRRG